MLAVGTIIKSEGFTGRVIQTDNLCLRAKEIEPFKGRPRIAEFINAKTVGAGRYNGATDEFKTGVKEGRETGSDMPDAELKHLINRLAEGVATWSLNAYDEGRHQGLADALYVRKAYRRMRKEPKQALDDELARLGCDNRPKHGETMAREILRIQYGGWAIKAIERWR